MGLDIGGLLAAGETLALETAGSERAIGRAASHGQRRRGAGGVCGIEMGWVEDGRPGQEIAHGT